MNEKLRVELYTRLYGSVIEEAKLLDEEIPGWEDKIDLGRLDMIDAAHTCIGAQLGWPECSKMNNDRETNLLAYCWNDEGWRYRGYIESYWIRQIFSRKRKKSKVNPINWFKKLWTTN